MIVQNGLKSTTNFNSCIDIKPQNSDTMINEEPATNETDEQTENQDGAATTLNIRWA